MPDTLNREKLAWFERGFPEETELVCFQSGNFRSRLVRRVKVRTSVRRGELFLTPVLPNAKVPTLQDSFAMVPQSSGALMSASPW
jgi:hypothetical protein